MPKHHHFLSLTSSEVHGRLLALFGLGSLDLAEADYQETAQGHVVAGKAQLWQFRDLEVRVIFQRHLHEKSIRLEATIPSFSLADLDELLNLQLVGQDSTLAAFAFSGVQVKAFARSGSEGESILITATSATDWGIPGIDAVKLEKPQLQIRIRNEAYRQRPVIDFTISALLHLGQQRVPVDIGLPIGPGSWILNIRPPGIAFPNLAELTALLMGTEAVSQLPQEVKDLPGFQLEYLSLRFSFTEARIEQLAFGLGTKEPWKIIPEKLVLDHLALRLSITRNSAGNYGYQGSVSGEAQIERFKVAASIPIPLTGVITLEASTTAPLPGLGEFTKLLGGQNLADSLPKEWAESGSMNIDRFRLALDLGKREVQQLALSLSTATPWPLWEPNLTLQEFSLSLDASYTSGQLKVDGNISGVAEIKGRTVGARLEKDGDTWTLALTRVFTLPTFAELIALSGDGTEAFLPEKAKDIPAVRIHPLELHLNRTAHVVRYFAFGAKTSDPWEIVTPWFVLESAAIGLEIENPFDKDQRSLSGSITATSQLFGTGWTVEASREHGGDWMFGCYTAAGDPVVVSTIAQTIGFTLPEAFGKLAFYDLDFSYNLSKNTFAGSGTIHFHEAILEASLETAEPKRFGFGMAPGSKELAFKHLLELLTNGQGGMPEALPELWLETLNCDANCITGDFTLAGRASLEWDLFQTGKPLEGTLDIDFKRDNGKITGFLEGTLTLGKASLVVEINAGEKTTFETTVANLNLRQALADLFNLSGEGYPLLDTEISELRLFCDLTEKTFSVRGMTTTKLPLGVIKATAVAETYVDVSLKQNNGAFGIGSVHLAGRIQVGATTFIARLDRPNENELYLQAGFEAIENPLRIRELLAVLDTGINGSDIPEFLDPGLKRVALAYEKTQEKNEFRLFAETANARALFAVRQKNGTWNFLTGIEYSNLQALPSGEHKELAEEAEKVEQLKGVKVTLLYSGLDDKAFEVPRLPAFTGEENKEHNPIEGKTLAVKKGLMLTLEASNLELPPVGPARMNVSDFYFKVFKGDTVTIEARGAGKLGIDQVGEVDFHLDAAYDQNTGDFHFKGALEAVQPISAVKLLTAFAGLETPAELPADLQFQSLDLEIKQGGYLYVFSELKVPLKLPFGMAKLDRSSITLKFERNTAEGIITCQGILKGSGQLTDDIRFDPFEFIFAYEKPQWELRGTTTASIFGKTFFLSASFKTIGDKNYSHLEWKSDKNPLLDIPGIASFNVTHLALFVERGTNNKWEFEAASDFMVFNPVDKTDLFIIEESKLELFDDESETRLSITNTKAEFFPMSILPVDENVQKVFAVGFNGLKVTRQKTDSKEWTFSIGAYLQLTDQLKTLNPEVYEFVEKVFPAPGGVRKIEGSIGYDGKTLEMVLTNTNGLRIPNLFKDILIPDPDYPDDRSKDKILFDIGESFVLLEKVRLGFGTTAELEVTFGFALPSKLNDLFFETGSKYHGFFKVYDGTANNLTRFSLKATTKGFSGSVKELNIIDTDKVNELMSDLIDLKGFEDTGTHLIIDMDVLVKNKEKTSRYGKLKLTKPVVEIDFQKGAFKLGGGFAIMEVEEEIDGKLVKVTKLTLPFLPVKKLLEAVKLKEAAKWVPKGIPIRSIDFFHEGKLSLDGPNGLTPYIKDLLGPELGAKFNLPPVFNQLASQAGPVLNRLPDRFKEYLSIHLPPNFQAELNIRPDGTFSFSAEVEKPENAPVGFKDYVQLLVPGPPGQLFGIRLRKLGLGSALANQAIRLDLSAEMDSFDLLTLGASLILPDKQTLSDPRLRILLPERKTLRRTAEIRDLILFVVILKPVPIPIPIPVFFTKLALANYSLEGTEAEFNLAFTANAGPAELLKELAKLKSFFTEGESFLDVDSYGMLGHPNYTGGDSPGLIVHAGPTYLQLPGFMGYEGESLEKGRNILIGSKSKFPVNTLDLVKLGLNAAKGYIADPPKRIPTRIQAYRDDKWVETGRVEKKALNYLVEYLPLEHRYAIKKIQLFFFFDLHVAWAFATPDEFADVVYPKMLEAYKNKVVNGKHLPAPRQTSPAKYLLDLLVEEDDVSLPPGEDQGVVLFLRGGIDIQDQIVLEGAIGFSLSERKGLRTGIALKGKIFDWIETESFFFVKINPASQKEFVKVLGNTFLRVFDRTVLEAQIEVTPDRLSFSGMLDAFPAGFPIQLKGAARGLISEKAFVLQAMAGLQLGQLRIAAAVNIDINGQSQLFQVEMTAANAYFRLNLSRELSGATEIIRAAMDVKAFGLLALSGQVQIMREPQRLSLQGHTLVQILALELLRIDVEYRGEIDTQSGLIAFSGTLKPGSYFLSPHCQVSGGAAFYTWFSGPRAGDFVMSLGGYHPAFAVPAHYPSVPRLALRWQIDSYTTITGEGYMALTPNAIMAGAALNLVYQRDNIRFWLSAQAHFLCQWKPIYYRAEIGVSVGASYTIWFLGWSKTISISVDATLQLWGPPTGGYVEVNLPIVRITIPFGEKERSRDLPLANWGEFRKAFLPQNILNITPEGGVIQMLGTDWLVRPDELSFTISTAVPASASLNIKPLRRIGIASDLRVEVMYEGQVVDLVTKPLRGSVPAALWGHPDDDALDPGKSLVDGVTTAIHVPALPTKATTGLQVPGRNLEYLQLERTLPRLTTSRSTKRTAAPDLATFQAAVDASATTRKTAFDEVLALGLEFPAGFHLQNGDLGRLSQTMFTEWTECPAILEPEP